jgi:hypothetical protein
MLKHDSVGEHGTTLSIHKKKQSLPLELSAAASLHLASATSIIPPIP